MTTPTKIGIIGTGNIAPAYIKGCAVYPNIELAACADIDMDRAQAFAGENGLQAMSVDDLLAAPDIPIIINLTIPRAHAEVSAQVIAAGKHVYNEKPLTETREQALELMAAANAAGVRVGCAPDTFLGGGGQTARKLIDDGVIGSPVAAVAFMAGHGHESWHPNPHFYYQPGGGPLLDMGPYYITALVNLLGPVTRVTGSTKRSFDERIATSKHRPGEVIPVETDTHLTALLDFASGATATIIMSFDIWKHNLPKLEIYGSEGSLEVPDPNTFRGPVRVWEHSTGDWRDVELTHTDAIGRGTGVADMALAIEQNRPHRVSGELALHVLDVMQAVTEASEQSQHIDITTTLERPAPIAPGLPAGQLE